MPANNSLHFSEKEIKDIQSTNFELVTAVMEIFPMAPASIRYNSLLANEDVMIQVPIISIEIGDYTVAFIGKHVYDGYNHCDAINSPHFLVFDASLGDPEEFGEKFPSIELVIEEIRKLKK